MNADQKVQGAFTAGPGPKPPRWSQPASPAGAGQQRPATPYIELPIAELRFAHNDQAERFGRPPKQENRCILQLAVELLSRQKSIDDVPTLNACLHEGLWWSRTGNRRLGALRLVHRFAPRRFPKVRARYVDVDDTFVYGTCGRAPKLTTSRNGESCRGRWMLIRETGEAIGPAPPHIGEYGADLLTLLPLDAFR